jgi:hypothetical protein
MSTKTTVPLAYDLYEPPNSHLDRHERPIVILHGLFGSKRNNRTVSRCAATLPSYWPVGVT